MTLTDDRSHPGINKPRADGQNEAYLVLSDEERAKGFVRPVRTSYRHVGEQPKHALRALTDDERTRHAGQNYVAFEAYPSSEGPVTGRYWTQARLDLKVCGTTTTMAQPLAETYARDPKFYGATFCCACRAHFPVAEFRWEPDGTVLGT